jgi:hypothetical protein
MKIFPASVTTRKSALFKKEEFTRKTIEERLSFPAWM